ncbi:MAG: bifunctional (p)ppGpp synthetase/guanosine-3',5'-bis(diphosphate) 3'-pyrophosphohydrolase [Oscillospiraceae bacterium]|nr:bifunctional (p)ppGpp synthetase/guanosine-3',5'-bis(diphosphate) 3'-pyrophosphohydrolase [Oscillospiraceae bacterium]
MDKKLKNLIKKIQKYSPFANIALVERAYNYAQMKHEGQTRVSGEPFVTHPIEVANILAEMELDIDSIVAALLHDTVEDTDSTHAEIKEKFGEHVAMLVEGVTKLDKIPYSTKEDEQVENLRKMFFAMAKDIRVILIKLADRIHNMRTLKSLPEYKQREKARETLEIYAPIAHRLGMSKVKWELEDLSLRYIDPIGYYEIVDKISQKRAEREAFINKIMQIFRDKLAAEGIKGFVEGRPKHFYSIYRKMFAQNSGIEEIYDLFAVRIIVDTVSDCYAVLGMVHELYKPIPGRFKDYIAMPKPNMYQSLHSTLIGSDGVPFEIQIRTWDMHETAEKGIAAHWKYKEGKSGKDDLDEKLEWVRQLLEIQQDMTNSEVMQTLKIDLFSDDVFVFTPKGDVRNLPAGSTIIDFAYAIHSEVGNKMMGGKVNGKIATLDYIIQNGDIVEIITSGHVHGPSRDWLKICKTSQARNKINQWFKKENRAENIEKGKDLLEKDFKKAGVPLSFLNSGDVLNAFLKKYSFNSVKDFYSSLGYGGANAHRLVTRLKDEYKKTIPVTEVKAPIELITRKTSRPNTSGVVVSGIDNCLIRFSHCCNPVPGDDIVGYVTRGRGVAVHRTDCINILNTSPDSEELNRFIPVSWSEQAEIRYQSLLTITATDREALLADVTLAIKDLYLPVRGLNARTAKQGLAILDVTLEIKSVDQLTEAIKKLQAIDGVISVVRRRQ